MHWLLTTDALHRVEEALASQVGGTEAQHQAFAQVVAADRDMPRNMRVAGSVAEIQISGVLVPRMSFLLWLFGVDQTTYSSILSGLASAEADSSVSEIVLSIDSPGGAVDGLFDVLAAIEATSKPIKVRAGMAASAAYGIAAAAGPITARNAASSFGSVGVMASYTIDPDTVDITSTEAPNKRPDPSTEEGKAEIRKHLDAIHAVFADAIARGRGTSVEKVNADFGRGAVLLAAEAHRRGMIDSYPEPGVARAEGTRATVAQTPKEKTMNLEQLKAQHPELAEALRAEGREDGVKAERRRCLDHLQLGAAAGIPDQAAKAIESGASVSDMQATYLAAHMNRQNVEAAQADGDDATAASGAAPNPEAQEDVEDQVHDRAIAMLKGEAHA